MYIYIYTYIFIYECSSSKDGVLHVLGNPLIYRDILPSHDGSPAIPLGFQCFFKFTGHLFSSPNLAEELGTIWQSNLAIENPRTK